MDFELDDVQLELQRVAREVVDAECPPSLVRAVVEGRGDGAELWKVLVGLDWPGLAVAEEHGGSGLGAVELVLVLEELGRGADPTPFLATTSQYVPVVQACGDDGQQAELLGAVCSGGSGTVAWADGGVRASRRDGGGWRLDGAARDVVDGDRADEVAVVTGTGTFVVAAADVDATRRTTFDATLHVADLAFDGVPVAAERHLAGGEPGTALPLAVTGLAAATVGASQRIFDLALAHVKDRHQFGVPIGSFQAIKHMAVDVHIAIERARALCQFAALAIAAGDGRAATAASMAKAAAGDAQRIAAGHGVQFFGGLGFTWENDLHLFVRRAKAGELLLGGAAHHRGVVARSLLAGQP